jgi:hypothetical protein
VVDPGYQTVQDLRAGFANVKAIDEKMTSDQASIANEEAIRARVLKEHADRVERLRKIMFPPKPWDNVQPAPHTYKPIDINNQYTYDRVYVPPETATDQKVLSEAKSVLGTLDALHEKRVETMTAKCSEPTCDVPKFDSLIQDNTPPLPLSTTPTPTTSSSNSKRAPTVEGQPEPLDANGNPPSEAAEHEAAVAASSSSKTATSSLSPAFIQLNDLLKNPTSKQRRGTQPNNLQPLWM